MRECRFLCVFLALFATVSTLDAADEPAAQLLPGSTLDVAVAAGSTAEFTVDLPPGMAADLRLVQRGGSIDLRLIDAADRDSTLRIESGIAGVAEAPLLASASAHWRVILTARIDRGASTATLSLTPGRPATERDVERGLAFGHYVQAERLRFLNFKETKVTARSAAVDRQTRAEYAAADAGYTAAQDACGLRRTPNWTGPHGGRPR